MLRLKRWQWDPDELTLQLIGLSAVAGFIIFGGIVLLALLASGCGPVHPPMPPIQPRPVAVRTCVPGATVTLEGGAPRVFSYTATADASGNALYPAIDGDLSVVNIHLRADGFPLLDPVSQFKPANTDFFILNCEAVYDPSYQVQLPAWERLFHPLQPLVARGNYFQEADGSRWVGIEASSFNLLNRWQHGEDVRPVLAQLKAAGFNLIRVWTLYDAGTGAGDFRDIDYSRVGQFLDLCASYGIRVDLTAYAGNLTFRADHWGQLCSAVQGRTNVLLSPVNELEASTSNWIDISGFEKCAGVLTSSGSNGSEAWPPTQVHYTPDWLEFHTNDHDQWWRTSGHNAWEVSEGAYPENLPTITNEQTRFDKMDWSDKQRMLDRLKGGAEGCALLNAGCAFHMNQGKTAELMPPDVLQAAQAHVSGFHVFSLICQDGPYTHNTAVEMMEMLLRVYEHPGNPVECLARIPN